jgi:hypothetical protein
MYGDRGMVSITCDKCGQTVAGRFCSNCGAELRMAASPASGPIGHLYEELVGDGGKGYFDTLRTILRAPISGTLQFALDPTYKGHKTFLFSNIAASVAIAGITLGLQPKELYSPIQQMVGNTSEFQKLIFELIRYVGIFGGFLIGYWLFRFQSATSRTAAEFFKLSCLTIGMTAFLNIALDILGLLMNPVSGSPILVLPTLGLAGLFLYYLFQCQMQFWNLSFARVLVSMIFVGFVSGIISLPLLAIVR